jgi:hypothetical protein
MAVVLSYLRPESEFRLKNVGLRPVYLYGAFSGVTLAQTLTSSKMTRAAQDRIAIAE